MNADLFDRYVNTIKNELERYFDKIVSIILFGSRIQYNSNMIHSTDVDLLVVINDSCSSKEFIEIKKTLLKVEDKFFAQFREKELPFFSIGLQRATGMFTNIFVCRLREFKIRRFHKVFNINPVVGFLLAPKNSVWLSLLKNHQIVFGKNLFQEWTELPVMSIIDLIKSFLMNFLLAFGSLLVFPIYSKITKFSMESVKWSLFTWGNYYGLPVMSHKEIIANFLKKSSILERRALHDFIEFREKNTVGKFFPLLALIFVVKLHFTLLNN